MLLVLLNLQAPRKMLREKRRGTATLRARVAGAGRAVIHGVRAVAAASPWGVEVGAPRVVLRAQELALGLQAGAPVPKVQGEAV